MVEPSDLPSDPEFARKVEQTELEAWTDLDPSLEGSRLFEVRTLDGTTLILDRARDWPQSRILNLGVMRPVTAETLRSVLELAREAGIRRLTTDVSPIARPGTIARLLRQQGFRQTERNVIVARSTHEMPEPASFFRIRLATASDRDEVMDIMNAVMPGTPDWITLLAGQVGRPLWRNYVAIENGVPSGVGGVHISDDMGWLAPIWMREEYRGRGTQAALIAYAIRDAEAVGTDWIITSYPAAVPGRTRDFERLGFAIVYLRNHFVWEETN